MADLTLPQIQFVNALRSRRYHQTNSAMKRVFTDATVGYCCMGVACDVLGYDLILDAVGEHYSTYGVRRSAISKYASYSETVQNNPSHSYLPDNIAELLGLSNEDMTILAVMNDSYRFSFWQIADVYEYAVTHNTNVCAVFEALKALSDCLKTLTYLKES